MAAHSDRACDTARPWRNRLRGKSFRSAAASAGYRDREGPGGRVSQHRRHAGLASGDPRAFDAAPDRPRALRQSRWLARFAWAAAAWRRTSRPRPSPARPWPAEMLPHRRTGIAAGGLEHGIRDLLLIGSHAGTRESGVTPVRLERVDLDRRIARAAETGTGGALEAPFGGPPAPIRAGRRDDSEEDRRRTRVPAGCAGPFPMERHLSGSIVGWVCSRSARSRVACTLGTSRCMATRRGRSNARCRAVSRAWRLSPIRIGPLALPGNVGGRPGDCFPIRGSPRRPLSGRWPVSGGVRPLSVGSVNRSLEAINTHTSV